MKNEINRFNEDVVANPDMMEVVKAFGSDVEKIVAYANEKGYAFTVEGLEETATEEEVELSEDALDRVTGGANQNGNRNQDTGRISVVVGGAQDMNAVVSVF